jgi:hypothetical protein
MTAHPPPVPPEQRSDKDPRARQPDVKQGGKAKSSSPDPKTDQSEAVKQNTTNQGYQQDR